MRLVIEMLSHRMSSSPEYSSWENMKSRVHNPNVPCFKHYGGRGIGVHPDFESFEKFIVHIGEMPKDGKKYSIDRIDTSGDYTYGNVRWVEMTLQNRNKRKRVDNSSGRTGVYFNYRPSTGYTGVAATWKCLATGKTRQKEFSVARYGLLPAFAMACKHRDEMIRQLNQQGAGYSPVHGH